MRREAIDEGILDPTRVPHRSVCAFPCTRRSMADASSRGQQRFCRGPPARQLAYAHWAELGSRGYRPTTLGGRRGYQTTHQSVGAMGLPAGQWNAFSNSGGWQTTPLTRNFLASEGRTAKGRQRARLVCRAHESCAIERKILGRRQTLPRTIRRESRPCRRGKRASAPPRSAIFSPSVSGPLMADRGAVRSASTARKCT